MSIMQHDSKCIICSRKLTKQNSEYKSEMCLNCQANCDKTYTQPGESHEKKRA